MQQRSADRMTTIYRQGLVRAGFVASLLVSPAFAGHGGGQHPPTAVVNPSGLPAQFGPAPLRIDIPIDIDAVIGAWATGELLVNQTRSGVRYNQPRPRLLFYCEAGFVLEVTPGEVTQGRAVAPVYDAGNTRACAPGEALYVSTDQGLFCQPTVTPIMADPRDPKLSAFSQIILAGNPALALAGVCVGQRDQVLPALSQARALPATTNCRTTASGVRYRGQGRAGYTNCPR